MSEKKITIELTKDEAHEFVGGLSGPIRARVKVALASHKQDELHAKLGLPWEASPSLTGSYAPGEWCVLVSRNGKSLSLTEPQACLMATAPELAEALTKCLGFLRSDYEGTAGKDISGGAIKRVETILTKAGWIDGDA